MDEVDDFVLAVFREIVEIGNTTIENAGESASMARTGQNLVKEGERALKRLQPLCAKNVNDYGPNFLSTLKQNEDMHSLRAELMELLWGFEDYTDPDGFEAEKFAELSSLSRKSGMKILDIINRMNVKAPQQTTHGSDPVDSRSPISPPTSPFIPRKPYGLDIIRSPSSVPSVSNSLNRESLSTGNPGDGEVDMARLSISTLAEIEEALSLQPPPLPSQNPWHLRDGSSSTDKKQLEPNYFESRPVGRHGDESPIDPNSPLSLLPVGRLSPSPEISDNRSYLDEELHRPKPGHEPLSQLDTVPNRQNSNHYPPGREAVSIYALPRTHQGEQASSQGPGEKPRIFIDDGQPQPFLIRNNPLSVSSSSSSNHRPRRLSYEGSERRALHGMDDGLIPVEKEGSIWNAGEREDSRTCLVTKESSFYLHKGFCNGASESLRGGNGIKKVKKLSGSLARCISCSYEKYHNEVEKDINRLHTGTITKSGINYRLRFLQKSHIATKRSDDEMFGCLFCIHDGKTPEESDATVFYSAKALLAHISHHPRPLSQVVGITVVDQETVPYELQCDFDLHLPNPPAAHPVHEHLNEVKSRPTGTAIQTVRKLIGQRVLMDGSPAHELAFGSRVVGITWPAQYGGEWIFCWHNGLWASIPAACISVNTPSTDLIKIDNTSQTQAKALWKWNPRDGKGWLKFDKDELISNISWQKVDQWFWSGSTSKGKWGIFPHDFIDTNTIQEPPRSNSLHHVPTASSLEKKPSAFSRFGPKSITGRSDTSSTYG